MWRYIPDLLATPVPRYTSFPTAAEFTDTVDAPDMDAALAGVGQGAPVSLYLHIPYCREICWYCGCNTGAANRTGRLDAYLQRLGQEIDLVATSLGGRGKVTRIAWGGGSPNALAPDAFDRLNDRLLKAFDGAGAVGSIEVDPRGLGRAWAASIARNRIGRVSLGVQTFAPHIQAAIGRVQPEADIANSVGLLCEAGVGSINFDLMYGLPGQSTGDLVDTLNRAIAMGPDRLAVFGYAHVPHLLPRQRRIDASALPSPRDRFVQAGIAHDLLTAAGYQAIGFDHFARTGDAIAIAASAGKLRRNFQGFTEDASDTLIGLGASAISAFPDRLLQNEKNTGRYHLKIGSGRFATARGLRRTALDARIGAAIEQVLCNGRADLSGLPLTRPVEAALERFRMLGLVARDGHDLSLAPDGLPYARSIAATLDPYRAGNQVRFSSAV
ncbi:MAG: oxygen-independent coproporphyrinogen III oxidase [Sphingomonas sp.]|jgi:oxygen-independent coproporphyrinogen-3 oxidase|uniref:oxygen-independent coproporphyrinogen III oxidase n=1 Tax=Sphingomonas sp. TaxID=28214 RepID=UPI003565857C